MAGKKITGWSAASANDIWGHLRQTKRDMMNAYATEDWETYGEKKRVFDTTLQANPDFVRMARQTAVTLEGAGATAAVTDIQDTLSYRGTMKALGMDPDIDTKANATAAWRAEGFTDVSFIEAGRSMHARDISELTPDQIQKGALANDMFDLVKAGQLNAATAQSEYKRATKGIDKMSATLSSFNKKDPSGSNVTVFDPATLGTLAHEAHNAAARAKFDDPYDAADMMKTLTQGFYVNTDKALPHEERVQAAAESAVALFKSMGEQLPSSDREIYAGALKRTLKTLGPAGMESVFVDRDTAQRFIGQFGTNPEVRDAMRDIRAGSSAVGDTQEETEKLMSAVYLTSAEVNDWLEIRPDVKQANSALVNSHLTKLAAAGGVYGARTLQAFGVDDDKQLASALGTSEDNASALRALNTKILGSEKEMDTLTTELSSHAKQKAAYDEDATVEDRLGLLKEMYKNPNLTEAEAQELERLIPEMESYVNQAKNTAPSRRIGAIVNRDLPSLESLSGRPRTQAFIERREVWDDAITATAETNDGLGEIPENVLYTRADAARMLEIDEERAQILAPYRKLATLPSAQKLVQHLDDERKQIKLQNVVRLVESGALGLAPGDKKLMVIDKTALVPAPDRQTTEVASDFKGDSKSVTGSYDDFLTILSRFAGGSGDTTVAADRSTMFRQQISDLQDKSARQKELSRTLASQKARFSSIVPGMSHSDFVKRAVAPKVKGMGVSPAAALTQADNIMRATMGPSWVNQYERTRQTMTASGLKEREIDLATRKQNLAEQLAISQEARAERESRASMLKDASAQAKTEAEIRMLENKALLYGAQAIEAGAILPEDEK